jgi:uncharacterized membrane protein YeaQ/YmgE (transglycosylase-associated protein family)
MQSLIELLIGIVAGCLAKVVVPAKARGDFATTILLGVIGSFLIGAFARTPGSGPRAIASVAGALVLAGVFRFAVRRGQRRHGAPEKRSDRIPVG